MPKLPVVNGREAAQAFRRDGFVVDHQTGGHLILWHPEKRVSIPVPLHGGRDLKPGTLRRLIRDAGLTIEEFRQLLE